MASKYQISVEEKLSDIIGDNTQIPNFDENGSVIWNFPRPFMGHIGVNGAIGIGTSLLSMVTKSYQGKKWTAIFRDGKCIILSQRLDPQTKSKFLNGDFDNEISDFKKSIIRKYNPENDQKRIFIDNDELKQLMFILNRTFNELELHRIGSWMSNRVPYSSYASYFKLLNDYLPMEE